MAAAILLPIPAASAAPICQTRGGGGFDCTPLQLQGAQSAPINLPLAEQNLAQHGVETTAQGAGTKAPAANPDSEHVLEEEAREGNSEALAKQAKILSPP